MRDIAAVMNDHVDRLMAIRGVIGVGIGALENGSPCLLVLITEKTDEHDELVPGEIEGYPVRVEEIGEVRAMDRGSSPTS